MQSATRMIPAFVIALLAGVVSAIQLYAAPLVVSQGVGADQLQLLLPALGLLSIAVSPFGAAVAGYVWGRQADVPADWLRFTGATVLAAFVGFLGTVIALLALLVGAGAMQPTALAGQLPYAIISSLGIVSVGLVALAGGAVAEFRSPGGGGASAA